jgi:ATP-dependent Lhr-like helicase
MTNIKTHNTIFDTLPFHPVLKSWFAATFESVSPPQAQGWPSISAGNHTLILAPTGSGKTLAAFLWSIDELFRRGLDDPKFDKNPRGIHTLYVSPLKALNNDIQRNLNVPIKEITNIAVELGYSAPQIRTMVRTGDTPPKLRQSMLKHPPHILITTPESLYLVLNSDKGRQLFSHLRYLILDEIHSITTNKRGVHLSLSLERLMPLCRKEPVRIGLSATQKPLDRIAAYLGGQKKFNSELKPRAVSIIDCGQRKKMDLKVIAPVPDFADLSDASIWPAVLKKLYDFITSHKTTLVFVNMRSQTERLTRQLNEMHKDKTSGTTTDFAMPHHGSMSREMRFDVEDKLKKGKISAVIATSSLELGIDIGSIDLVVQLEAPKSISGALQRVGRSGHLLKATSKGRIIPLYAADLDDAAAIVHCMKSADIEEVVIPQNCLDVLAQQIVAEVATKTWPRQELYHLFQQSYCYRHLSVETFNQVLLMLTGRFSDSKVPALKPVINWDKVNDCLIALPGTRLLANLNGGTIPDRGYFGVYLSGVNKRLGEMEEEFVFESKIGDIFYLGNNEWRIESIAQDRITVIPASSVKPRAPFWKGELGYQAHTTAEKIGAFREIFLENISRNKPIEDIAEEYNLDIYTAQNLLKFLTKQQQLTEKIPTHRQILAESFYDAARELHLVVHTSSGGRVNALWAIACAAILEIQIDSEVQYSYDDDGFILRFRETTDPPVFETLFQKTPEELEQLLIERIAAAPVFAIQFRYNAARSLLLTRSRPGKRIPLWLQRLRAADLLQAIKKYPDFPILVETYRSCLQDIFDLNGLLKTIKNIQKGTIQTKIVHTPYPSPMVSGLIFNFVSNQVYEQDRSRAPGEVAAISNSLLMDVFARETVPAIISEETINKSRMRWQHLNQENQAKDAEQLFLIIQKLGPINTEDLSQRSRENISPWIEKLKAQNRIVEIQEPVSGLIAAEDDPCFRDLSSPENAQKVICRFLESEGPVSSERISRELLISDSQIESILSQLYSEREVVKGQLLKNSDETFWCHKDNFAELYRRAIAVRRRNITSVEQDVYYRFLLHWHGISGNTMSLQTLIEKYRGIYYPILFIEREILRSRLCGQKPDDLLAKIEDLNNLISRGEVIFRIRRDGPESKKIIGFMRRGEGSIFTTSLDEIEISIQPDADDKMVHNFLQENGASLYADIEKGTGLSSISLLNIIVKLLYTGFITTDNYSCILSAPDRVTYGTRRSQSHVSRQVVRKKVQDQIHLRTGHWFLTTSFAVMGRKNSLEEQIEHQARLMLLRHGIVVKEWYRREKGLLPWYQIFQALKRMEWQGEIRRGYFIKGLSGIQFALPEAMDLLQSLPDKEYYSESILVSTIDPALPLGGNVDWGLINSKGKNVPITRAAGNHLLFFQERPVLYSENYGNRLWTLSAFDKKKAEKIVGTLKTWLRLPASLRPRKKLILETIDDVVAADSKLAGIFMSIGFEKEGSTIILWPSGV